MTKKENRRREGKQGFWKETGLFTRKTGSSPDLKGNSWGSARFGCVSPVVDLGA